MTTDHHKHKVPPRRFDRKPFYAISIFTVLWLIGIATDEPSQVLAQAIRICLSCIGIG